MKIQVSKSEELAGSRISARCPHCGKEGVLDQIGKDLRISTNQICGQRRCPDPNCSGHIIVVLEAGKIIESYPHIRIDFDSSDIPQKIVSTFEEALDCHSINCHTAAAIMVRRTLEEICEDRGAVGKNLNLRLKDLGSKIVIPKELIDAMDELRLLGNDAAHIEAKDYEQISADELKVAISFTKEILKAIYQYASLLEKLRTLKKDSN